VFARIRPTSTKTLFKFYFSIRFADETNRIMLPILKENIEAFCFKKTYKKTKKNSILKI
jgi:hypothetical protein